MKAAEAAVAAAQAALVAAQTLQPKDTKALKLTKEFQDNPKSPEEIDIERDIKREKIAMRYRDIEIKELERKQLSLGRTANKSKTSSALGNQHDEKSLEKEPVGIEDVTRMKTHHQSRTLYNRGFRSKVSEEKMQNYQLKEDKNTRRGKETPLKAKPRIETQEEAL